jgi:hypothetical protein
MLHIDRSLLTSVPAHCPDLYCSDPIPEKLSKALRSMLNHRAQVIKKYGEDSPKVLWENSLLCQELKKEASAQALRAKAASKGWPAEADWSEFRERIVARAERIREYAADPGCFTDFVAYRALNNPYDLEEFNNTPALQAEYLQRLPPG